MTSDPQTPICDHPLPTVGCPCCGVCGIKYLAWWAPEIAADLAELAARPPGEQRAITETLVAEIHGPERALTQRLILCAIRHVRLECSRRPDR